MSHRPAHIAVTLFAALSACTAGQDATLPTNSASSADNTRDEQKATATLGEIVSEMSPSILYVHHAENGDYWFGSDDSGAYRYDGRTLVNFTVKHGLASDTIRGIQEDRLGNMYFTTYQGISKFDGRSLTTLRVSPDSASNDWKLRPDDLWFVGPQDAGVVFRYDGDVLHRLEFPKTELGDKHLAEFPRDRFPNAKYSPYDVYCILRDSHGHLWFGTACVGACRYDGDEFRWVTDDLLVEAPVRSIIEGRDGNYWFTHGSAQTIGEPRTLSGFDEVEPGARGTIVDGMCIVEDRAGKIWTATYLAGATKYDGEREVNYPIQGGDVALTTFSVSLDRQGVLWVGTHNGGAFRFNGETFESFRP